MAPGRIAMIGDDLDADIAGGRRAGRQSILVLSGKAASAALEGGRPGRRPDAVAADLAEIGETLVAGRPAPSE